MIEWTGLWKSLPGRGARRGREPRRVRRRRISLRARAFYRRLGFDEMLFESTDFFDPMAPWYDRELPEQHMVMMMSSQGGGDRAVSC